MIYQMHPNHGRHKAISSQEAQANEENGWETVTEEEFYAGIVKKEKPVFNRDDLAELFELKFGKKPHHKMTAETIQAKLDE